MFRSPRLPLSRLAHLLTLLAVGSASLLPASAQQKSAVVTSQTEISDSVQQQIAAFSAEKATRTVAQKRIDSSLLYEIKQRTKQKLPAGLKTLQTGTQVDPKGMTLLDARAVVTAGLLDDIQKTGGTIVSASQQWHSVRFLYPITKLEKLAEHPEFRSIRPAVLPTTNVGSVTSQGDITHRAASARSTYGTSGSGVKVGVLSDSIDFLSRSMTSGDLGTVYYLTGQAGSGTGEGTAMLEIVHDLAPGAALYFATAFSGHAGFAANIRGLRDAGCSVIIDDVSYADESPFQDGDIAQAVQDVANSGVLYFSSAGNSGNLANNTSSVWEGDFADSGLILSVNGNPVGKAHTFGSSIYNNIQTGGSQRRLNLFWSDALEHSGNDYDVYVTNAAGTSLVSLSTNTQDGDDDPYEFIASVNPNDRILLVASNNPQPRYLHLNVGRGRLQYATNGRITGHSGTAGMFSVAAVDVHTTSASNPFVPAPFAGGSANPVEAFSSEGPRRMFYDMNGSEVTPGNILASGGTVLNKPDIAAADGVVTSFPLNGGLNPFYGTSAAAPHAGAIAALLKSYNPSASATQIGAALRGSVLDIMSLGWDTTSGAGIVMAPDAIQRLFYGNSPLPNSGSVNGAFYVDSAGDVLEYTFTLTGDMDNIQITAATSSSLAVNVFFYDQDGTSLLAAAYGNYGDSPSVDIPHLGPGTYFVKVQQAAGRGSFVLSNSALVSAPNPNDTELNDSYGLANSLPYLGEKKGRLGYSRTAFNVQDDNDWYKVTVTDESDFKVTAQAISSALAVNIHFYDQDGTSGLASAYGNYGESPAVTIPHIGPGTYYMLVQRAAGFGNYRLFNSITIDPVPSDLEPNDDSAHALTLPYAGSKKGRLGYSRLPYGTTDDNDWYKVTVPASTEGDFTVTAASLTNALAVNIHFYDQDGTSGLASAYGNYGESPAVTIPHIGPGTYYMLVQRAGGYGAYQLSDSMVNAPAVDETEINDAANQANTLGLNGSLRGKLGYSRNPYSVTDDTDWYKVTVTGDGDWDVRVQPDSTALAVNIFIYDQDGTSGLASAYGNYGDNIHVPIPHLGPGTYYVLVQRAGGFGRYTVSNTFTAQNTPNDSELNDTQTTATVLSSLYPSRTGRLGYSRNPYSTIDDQDWYRVTLSGNVTLNVLPSANLAIGLALVDSSGSIVTNVNGNAGSPTSISASNLTLGTYYVALIRASGYGTYSLATPGVVVSGTLTLQSIASGAPSQPIDFVFRPTDNTGGFTQTINVAPNGAFSLPNIPKKQYTVHIKGSRYLAKNVTVNATGGNVSGVSALLKAGDSNNDNVADVTDLLAIINHYNKKQGNSGYLDTCDFNLDGADDVTDLLLIINNYNQKGDN